MPYTKSLLDTLLDTVHLELQKLSCPYNEVQHGENWHAAAHAWDMAMAAAMRTVRQMARLPAAGVIDDRILDPIIANVPMKPDEDDLCYQRRICRAAIAGLLQRGPAAAPFSDTARLDHVLLHGLPLKRDERYRMFGFADSGWHANPRDAIDVGLANPEREQGA